MLLLTVSEVLAVLLLASVADTVCVPAVAAGTLNVTPEGRLPLPSLVVVATCVPSKSIVTGDPAANPVPLTVTVPPTLWLDGLTAMLLWTVSDVLAVLLLAYSFILPAHYSPIIVILLSLFLRSFAFVFRIRALLAA